MSAITKTKSDPVIPFRVQLYGRKNCGRTAIEDYVRGVFKRRFNANPQHLFPWIAELRGAGDKRIGALGLRWGGSGDFFSETYMDERAECAIARQFHCPVERSQIIEFGHFAASQRGAGQAVLLAMAVLTKRLPVTWMLSTLNQPMRQVFGRAGVPLVPLAEARPERLPGATVDWGSYYDSRPKVMAADLRVACRLLIRDDSIPVTVAGTKER